MGSAELGQADWFDDQATAHFLSTQLRAAGRLMQLEVRARCFPAPFTRLLLQVLRGPDGLLGRPVMRGAVVTSEDLHLWAVLALLTAASAAQKGSTPLQRLPRAFWLRARATAAAAEFLGAALDLIDDLQDGDSAFVALVSPPLALNAGLALLQLSPQVLLRKRAAGWPAAVLRYAQQTFHSQVLVSLGGQFLDLAFENRSSVSLEQSMDMTEHKSGALLALIAELGALASVTGDALPEEYLEAVKGFGMRLGTWGQVLNDVQDARESAHGGKSDRRRKKKTLPLVMEQLANREKKQQNVNMPFVRDQAEQMLAALCEALRLQAELALETLEQRYWPHPLLRTFLGAG